MRVERAAKKLQPVSVARLPPIEICLDHLTHLSVIAAYPNRSIPSGIHLTETHAALRILRSKGRFARERASVGKRNWVAVS